jgi:hypothetical protein
LPKRKKPSGNNLSVHGYVNKQNIIEIDEGILFSFKNSEDAVLGEVIHKRTNI